MRYIDENRAERLSSQRALKDGNMRRIFSKVAAEGAVSRASLARSLGLTPSTVSVLVEEMISRRLIRESAVDSKSAAGRKPVLVSVDPAGMRIPVLSFKREGILYTLLDGALSQIESRFGAYAGVPAATGWKRESYREIPTDEIVRVAERLLQGSGISECWERTPVLCVEPTGTIDWEQGTFSSTAYDQRGSIEFIGRLRKGLRNIPVLVCSQTRACGYAELTASGAMDRDTLFIMTGEGIGSSIFLGGKCFVGATDLAGEMGHISLDPNGPRCLCGNRGCLEKLADCAAIRAQASAARGEALSWEAVCAAYRAGEPDIEAVVHRAARYLLVGISNMICALNVQRVILGGAMVDLGERFLDDLKALAQETGYRKGLSKAELCFAQLHENSGITGIARLYQDCYHSFAG